MSTSAPLLTMLHASLPARSTRPQPLVTVPPAEKSYHFQILASWNAFEALDLACFIPSFHSCRTLSFFLARRSKLPSRNKNVLSPRFHPVLSQKKGVRIRSFRNLSGTFPWHLDVGQTCLWHGTEQSIDAWLSIQIAVATR